MTTPKHAATVGELLAGELPRGVYRLQGRYDAEQLERAALDAGWLFAPLWGTGTRAETLESLGVALGFGEHYGRNLDALADCLRDLVGSTLLLWADWAGLAENDPDAMRRLLRVLQDAGERGGLLAVVLAGDGPEDLDVPTLVG